MTRKQFQCFAHGKSSHTYLNEIGLTKTEHYQDKCFAFSDYDTKIADRIISGKMTVTQYA